MSLEIEPQLETVLADPLRLQQMLSHLLDNAVKLNKGIGEIELKVGRWEDWLAFTVSDTGRGIPEELQHLIFRELQPQDNELTWEFEGTGLGLLLTQRLAKAHGGDVSFISRTGQGSQFTLLLPAEFSSLENRQELESFHFHALILVVSSTPQSIENITDLLIRLGYGVVIARTGIEALEKARQLKPHYIFLNPNLPLLSGWDLLTLLKSDPYTQNIRVLITSSVEDQKLSQENGADGFLSLPIQFTDLEEILSQPEKTSDLPQELTILYLSTGFEQSNRVTSFLELQVNYRLLEADNVEQAEMIGSVWDVDAIILESSLKAFDVIQSLKQCESLSHLPVITLDTQTTQAANSIGGLSVFPCLLPVHHRLEQLLEVIQIAVGLNNSARAI